MNYDVGAPGIGLRFLIKSVKHLPPSKMLVSSTILLTTRLTEHRHKFEFRVILPLIGHRYFVASLTIAALRHGVKFFPIDGFTFWVIANTKNFEYEYQA